MKKHFKIKSDIKQAKMYFKSNYVVKELGVNYLKS